MFASDLDHALAELGVGQRIAMLRPGPAEGSVHFRSPAEVLGRGLAPGARAKLHTMRALRRLVTEWEPDVVQAHGGETLKYAIPASRGRSAVVYRRIGSTPVWMAGRFRRAGHRAIIRRAARVVAVADATRAETIKLFRLDPDRVITIPNGVDVERARPGAPRESTRAGLGIAEAAPIVISVGAFTEEKDPEAHVEVVRRVTERRPDVIFLMVGDGPLADQTRNCVRLAGLDGSIRLLGPRAEIPDLLGAADVLLLASRTEGMPGVLIEVGVAGCAAAAYALAGVPEVVQDGRTGLLAPPGDIAALAARVVELLDDDDARQKMGESAREICTERFDIRSIAARYLELYEELAETAGAPITNAAAMRPLEPLE
jgi:glycosyltransferase involved in cell wall biosynthesis